MNNTIRNWDVFVGCSENSISVIVKNICNILELSGLFVCLGGLIKVFQCLGEGKIAAFWFARGGSVPRLTLWPHSCFIMRLNFLFFILFFFPSAQPHMFCINCNLVFRISLSLKLWKYRMTKCCMWVLEKELCYFFCYQNFFSWILTIHRAALATVSWHHLCSFLPFLSAHEYSDIWL